MVPRSWRRPPIELKTPAQLELMRAAGLVVARTLDVLAAAVAPGVTTADLDKLAEVSIRDLGGIPSFLGYQGYPATICTSVNDEVVHAIPSPDRVLRDGDLISVDCGAIVAGWHGDAAMTVGVGTITEAHARLIEVCERALWAGIAKAQAGGRLGDISHAVEQASDGYGVVLGYTGHGIGTEMHMDPRGAQLWPPRPRSPPGPGHGAGHRADADPRQPGDRRAGRRLDRSHRRRQLGGPLRAHDRHYPGGPESPHLPGIITNGGACPARRGAAR
jgi:methionyl aminopeptidase